MPKTPIDAQGPRALEHASRRRFLQLTAAAGLMAAGGVGRARAGEGEPVLSRVGAGALAPSTGRVRNVIFFVVDGMDHSTAMLADAIIRRRDGRPSAYVSLRSDPATAAALCMTHSRDSLVTDSAAAGSAFGIGEHIDNDRVNWVDDREPSPILVRAREAGLATGLVTTTRVTHATPASMACNVPDRNMEDAIAEQLLGRRFDLLLGGGARHFPQALLDRHTDLTIVRDAAGLRETPTGERLLGLFNASHMSYDLDRPETEPSIELMTANALKRLAALGDRRRGFLVQIEAGRVDHGGHSTDAAAQIHDQIAFDSALAAAVRFTDSRDDTLLIVTTDHGCGGPHLTLYEGAAAEGLDRLASARGTYEWLQAELGRDWASSPGLRDALVEMTGGADIPAARVAWLTRAVASLRDPDALRPDGFDVNLSPTALLGAMLANTYAVGHVSPNHNADYVDVLARGPGAGRLSRFIDNVDIHRLMIEELGLPPASA